MRALLAIFIISGLIYLSSSPTLAQVVINEISPTGDPEWVELYNISDTDIDLEGWEIQDGNSISTDDLTLSGSIIKHSFLVLYHPKADFKNRGWLNDEGDETVSLYKKDEDSPTDQFFYSKTKPGLTFSRIPDGTGSFLAETNPTPDEYNQVPSTPTPTPEPTSTPAPTTKTTPTLTTHTSTPTPLRTPTPTKTVTPTPEPEVTTEAEYPELILGESITQEPSEEPQENEDAKPKKSNLPVILTAAGLTILGSTVGYLSYNHYRKPKQRSKIPTSDSKKQA